MATTIVVFIVLMTLLIAYALHNFKKYRNLPVADISNKIISLTDENFQQQINENLILVDFWTSWCVPCKIMAPVLNDLAEDNEGKVVIGKVDAEHFKQLTLNHNVRNIPTMILFKNGKEVERFVGVKSREFLKSQISQYHKL